MQCPSWHLRAGVDGVDARPALRIPEADRAVRHASPAREQVALERAPRQRLAIVDSR